MYKTEGRIDKQFYNRMGKHFYTIKTRVFRAVYILLCLVLAVRYFWLEIYYAVFIFLAFAAFFGIIWYVIGKKKSLKVFAERLVESSGVDYIEYSADFEDDGVVCINKTSGGTNKFVYSSFVELAETDFEFLLFTKAWQVVPIFKSDLTEAEKGELLEFLKGKCSGIKKW